MATISKISKLNNPESYIQINLIKGFKYIDKAGEIVNTYFSDNVPPKFSMNLEGLLISQPVSKVSDLKVTPSVIWMKFTTIDSLDMVKDTFILQSNKIIDILDVPKVSRVGWRNFFIYELDTEDKQSTFFQNISPLANANINLVQMNLKNENGIECNVIIQPVTKNDSSTTPGILFDIDVYKVDDFSIKDINSTLREFRIYLSSEEGFLSFVNKILEKV